MQILIVGAGVGGLTLAALFERLPVEVTIIDRASNFDHAGYMLGLWPLGYRVLHGLSLYERYAAQCIKGNNYEVRDNNGRLVNRWSMKPITDRFGPNLSCSRPQLVKLLHSGLGRTTVQFDTSLESLMPDGEKVVARFSDGATASFDLVVGADGMGSTTRQLMFGDQPEYDTGWGGWVWWAPLDSLPKETFVEHWGAGRFAGAYPTRDGAGIFAGGPAEGGFAQDGPGRARRIRERFAGMGEMVDAWLDAMPGDDAEMYFWRMADVRSAKWSRGRIVLLGDAAAGFLPTAGIGASMAMESAAVLADELSRVNRETVEQAIGLYIQRRRRRVERIQSESRRLARLMFVKRPTLAWIRNQLTKRYSIERVAGSLWRSFEEPI